MRGTRIYLTFLEVRGLARRIVQRLFPATRGRNDTGTKIKSEVNPVLLTVPPFCSHANPGSIPRAIDARTASGTKR